MKKILALVFLAFFVLSLWLLFMSWVNKVSDTIEARKPTESETQKYSPYQDNTPLPAQKPCPSGNCKG